MESYLVYYKVFNNLKILDVKHKILFENVFVTKVKVSNKLRKKFEVIILEI